MSTSLLYHAFGIREYKYVRTEYNEGHTIFTIKKDRFSLRCPCCHGKNLIKHGSSLRWFHALPVGGRATYIKAYIPKVECKDCHTNRQIKIGFADSRFTFTRALGRYVLGLSRFMTIKDISTHLQLSWDIVKTIQKRYLKKRYTKLNLKELEQIAIDEINIGKGRYLTVLLNLKTGAVIFVGDGKGSDALVPFWEKIKRKRSVKIKAVAVDMSPAYTKAVRENLPKATIVYDHFHVIKLFNEKLSNFRRLLFNTTAHSLGKTALKGSRWLLLTARESLALRPDKMTKLESALSLNKPLSTSYYMKEDLRQLWGWDDKATASWHMDSWISMAKESGISMLIKFAKTLAKHKEGILAFYDYRISTGPLEGTNNKIKTMKRQAYGFRDYEFFKLKIMALHETKYALVG